MLVEDIVAKIWNAARPLNESDSSDKLEDDDSGEKFDKAYALLRKRLHDPSIKMSAVIYEFYDVTDEDEKANKRSEFVKKLHRKKDNDGNTMKFSYKEIVKILDIIKTHKSKVKTGASSKASGETIRSMLNDKSIDVAQVAYDIYDISPDADEIEKASARSKLYQKERGEKPFTPKETTDIAAYLRSTKA